MIERVFAPDFAHKGKLCGFGDALQQTGTPLDVGFAFQIGTTKALAWGWKLPGICKGRHLSASGGVSKLAADNPKTPPTLQRRYKHRKDVTNTAKTQPTLPFFRS